MSVPNRHLESRDTALEKVNTLHKSPSINSDPTLRGRGCLTLVVPPPLAVQERPSKRGSGVSLAVLTPYLIILTVY